MRENRAPRIYYATQVGIAPPTVVLFVNSTQLFDPTYQRYLLNVFREKLPFRDIPIKLYLRARKQSDQGGHSPADELGPSMENLDSRTAGTRADRPSQSPQPGHFDTATRFLNREVNELLADLDI
jgi:GTP-binding protein